MQVIRNMRNPDCPKCGKILDTFADDYWCPRCKVRIAKEDIVTYVPNTNKTTLLHCRNAWLTSDEFYYGDKKWQVSNMILAVPKADGILTIQFNDGIAKDFRLSLGDLSMAGAAGLLFGNVATVIAENNALKNQIKNSCEQWANTINMLISKRNPAAQNSVPIVEKDIIREKEVIVKIRCPYCKNLYNETLDKCPYCGARA